MKAALAISFANLLEVLVATYLINRFSRGVKTFETAWDVIKFVAFGSVLTPIISASICIAYLYPAGFSQGPDKGLMWLTWAVGDSIGALMFAPFLILVFGTPHHRLDKRELLELSVLLLSLITVCLTIFGPLSAYFEQKQLLMPWMCVPFLIWAGFRFCQLEAAGTSLLLFGIAIWGLGYALSVTPNFNVGLMFLVAFVGVTGTAWRGHCRHVFLERRAHRRGFARVAEHPPGDRPGDARDLTATIEALQAEVVGRLLAEKALRDSNDRFQQIAATISDVFWLMDITEMRVLYVNPAYEIVWGRPCASLYADPHSWLDSVHPDDHERALTFFDQETKDSQYDAEYRIVRPDGSVRCIWDRGYIVRDSHDRICRIAGLATDITEKKRLEEQLEEAQKRKSERN